MPLWKHDGPCPAPSLFQHPQFARPEVEVQGSVCLVVAAKGAIRDRPPAAALCGAVEHDGALLGVEVRAQSSDRRCVDPVAT